MDRTETHLVEVRKSEKRTSKAGNPMFQISLHDVDTGKFICLDWIVFSDKATRFRKMKLKALGVGSQIGENSSGDLVGKRAVVAVKQETYKDELVWAIDGDAEGFDSGYLPASEWVDPPENRAANLASELFDAKPEDPMTPF